MKTTKERWLPVTIPDSAIASVNYSVSDLGRVRREIGHHINHTRILRYGSNKAGYLFVSLSCRGKIFRRSVHRLVALAFISNPENKPAVNHKNGIKSDNRLSNLEWVTYSENERHSVSVLGKIYAHGEAHSFSKITANDVVDIRKEYATGSVFQRELGVRYGLTQTSISLIIRKRNWSRVA